MEKFKTIIMRSKPEVSPKITLETATIFEDPVGELAASSSGPSSLKASTRSSISTNRSSRGLSVHSNVTNYSQMTDGSGGLKQVGSSDDPNAGLLDDKLSITFFGRNINSEKGLYIYKSSIIVLPLVPMLILIIQSIFDLTDIIESESKLTRYETGLTESNRLSNLTARLQDERFFIIFNILGKDNDTIRLQVLNRESDEVFSKTDQAIEKLDPWRSDIPLAVFQSRIRFALRLQDLRDEAVDPKIEVDIDKILNFFNPVILQTITTYTKDIESFSERKKTWKDMLVYKNLLRALDNMGINSAYGFKYYLKGNLAEREKLTFLRTQVTSKEYLQQVKNFSPYMRINVRNLEESETYQKLDSMWKDVENETRTIDISNKTEVRKFATTMFVATRTYLKELSGLLDYQLKLIKSNSKGNIQTSRKSLYQSISILFAVFCIAPLIIYTNSRIAIASEAFIKTLTEQTKAIYREKKRGEKLLTRLLPKMIANNLKEDKKVSYSYDAATVMFCSIRGFDFLVERKDPIFVFKILNEIYRAFDERISSFDVYKVESINEKYMVASGVPKQNGNRHADEIAQLSLSLNKTLKNMCDNSSKFPRLQCRIGIHSGNTVGGVVGSKMPRFCLFGDTINLASRMETHGEPGKIQLSTATKAILDLTESGKYNIYPRGQIDIKGKGFVETFWLLGRSNTNFLDVGRIMETDLSKSMPIIVD